MEYLVLLLAPFIGILIGFIPALGATMAMLLLYPLLGKLDAHLIIIFYAVIISCKEFSGSVSAICFNLLGEITSAPVMQERKYIHKEHLHLNALRNTAYASVFGVFFGLCILIFSLIYAIHYPILLRTNVVGSILIISTCFLIFYDKKYYINFFLIICGWTLGQIGYDQLYGNFLTFNNLYLAGGIPSMSLLLGIYVIPKLFQMWQQTSIKKLVYGKNLKYNIHYPSIVRGGLVGAIIGLIPFIGNYIVSTVAHNFENFFYRKKNSDHSLKRISAAESANNSAQIVVLIPLLVLGLAIQPSEVITLQLLETKGWMVAKTSNFDFLLIFLFSMILMSVYAAVLCYSAVKYTLHFFSKYIALILLLIIFGGIINIIYMGYVSEQTLYFVIVLFVSTFFGMVLQHKNIDTMPLVIIFLLQNLYFDTISRIILFNQ